MDQSLLDRYKIQVFRIKKANDTNGVPLENASKPLSETMAAINLPSDESDIPFAMLGDTLGYDKEDKLTGEEKGKLNEIYRYAAKYGDPQFIVQRILNKMGDAPLGVSLLNQLYKYVTLKVQIKDMMNKYEAASGDNNEY
jgi:hypothetical protein